MLATGNADGTIRILDAHSLQPLKILGHSCCDSCICEKRANGSTAYNEGCQVQGHRGRVRTVSWGSTGELASASWDGGCFIWSPIHGAVQNALQGHIGSVFSVQLSPDATRVATAGEDKTVRLWTTDYGVEFCKLAGHTGTVWCVAWGPKGELASGSSDNSLKLWDLDAGTAVRSFNSHSNAVFAMAWGPNSKLVSGSWDTTCKIWDTETGTEVLTLRGHSDKVTAVACSLNGHVASGSLDKTVRVWDATNGAELFVLEGHASLVRSLAFFADGETLVSGAEDGTVRVWSVADRKLLESVNVGGGAVFSVAFAPTDEPEGAGGGTLIVSARKRDRETRTRESAEAHAKAATEDLEELREMIARVKRRRAQTSADRGPLSGAEGFNKLVGAMRTVLRAMGDTEVRAQRLREAEQATTAAKAAVVGVREELQRKQSEVRAACAVAQGGAAQQEVVQRKIQQRDMVRAEVSRRCREELEAVNASVANAETGEGGESRSKGGAAAAMSRVKARVDLLKPALDAARGGLSDGGKGRSQRVGMEAEEAESAEEAVAAYERWVQSCNGAEVARATDKALQRLAREFVKLAPTQSSAVSSHEESEDGENVLVAAGRALDAELSWLDRDVMAALPSRPLLRHGQELLESLVREFRVLRKVQRAWRELWEETRLHEEALDAGGRRRAAMEAAVERVKEDRQRVRDARFALEDAQTEIRRAEERGLGPEEVARLEGVARERRREFRVAKAALQDGVGALMEEERAFPEVLLALREAVEVLMKGMGASVTSELMQVLDPAMSLAAFDECSVLSTLSASRHVVYRARYGGEWFAVKEFVVSDHSEMARSLKEAGLLWRIRHPAVAELCAVFLEHGGAPKLFLQMPLYPHGQLDQWVTARAPPWWAVRQALTDTLAGLAHIHSLQVLHGDVKPANILIDGRQRARLADFDVSVDAAARTVATVAFSRKFMAPEVPHSGASPAADIFSLGKTADVEPIRAACRPSRVSGSTAGRDDVGAGYREEVAGVDAFVRVLTAAERERRPRAEAAGRHAFCVAVAERAQREEEPRECCVRAGERCVELKVAAEEGVECAAGHFVCRECLEGVARAAMEADLGLRRRRGGRVPCPMHPRECREDALSDADLARLLPGEVVSEYLRSRLELMEAAKVEALEQDYQAKVGLELERLLAMDAEQREVEAARKHIEEEVLQLKCPRCKQAFFDFDGCCALKCSRCGCGFCAWCLADCGADAHQHVGRCTAKPPGARGDPFFASKALVDGAQRERRAQMLRAFLDGLPAPIRERVLRDMRPVLDDRLPGGQWS